MQCHLGKRNDMLMSRATLECRRDQSQWFPPGRGRDRCGKEVYLSLYGIPLWNLIQCISVTYSKNKYLKHKKVNLKGRVNQRRLLRGGDLWMGLQKIHRSLSKRKVETRRHQQAEQVRHVCIPGGGQDAGM